ncbi:potassium/proton antiporter [Janibacter anophelis]|uniref:potassium/proton antiporter n=1 Tax=Janibacter anophelis TaxID=319054 RepID=UPI00082AAAE4|nr:potassium/proton antiporter [Janibacter anophelis]
MTTAEQTGSFGLSELSLALLAGSLVLVIAVAAVRLASRAGLPTLLLYLAIGLAVGKEGLGIPFDSDQAAQVLGYCALVLILVEGGLTTKWSSIRASVAPALALSTVGVLVSVGVVAVALHEILHTDWQISLLIGAILASTDAAAVFSVLRVVPLPRRLSGMLEAESGFNDAPVVLLVTALSLRVADPATAEPWWTIGLLAVAELTGGALVGLAIGWLGGKLMRRLASGTSGLFSLGVVAIGVLAYASAASIHTSGFIACYLAALVLGNMHLPHRQSVTGFAEALGWLAQIGLFVMLGMLATPSGFIDQLPRAVLAGLVLLLVARPLSVMVSLTPFGVPWREQAFLSWAGLRGAVPVVLATVPITNSVPGIEWVFDLVFMLVVIFTLVQAPLMPWVARALRVTELSRAAGVVVEAMPLEELGAELLDVVVAPGSRLAGVEVFELRLPKGANISLVVRGDETFVPDAHTRLWTNDRLLVVTPGDQREATEARLRSVARYGRLAGWRGDV